LEAIIYGTDQLLVAYRQIEARGADDERVVFTCKLKFTIDNIMAFQAGLVRRRPIYTLAQLHDRLYEGVDAAIRQFMHDKVFHEVEDSQHATGLLEAAFEQELGRAAHALPEVGLRFDGLVSWRPLNPAVEAGRSVKDHFDEQRRALEEEKNGLSQLLVLWQDVQALRSQATGVVDMIQEPLPMLRPEANEQHLWRFPSEEATQVISPIRSRATVRDRRVYVAELEGTIYCLNLATGQAYPGWLSPRIPGEVYGGLTLIEHGPGAPALLVPCTDGKLYALHPETGATQGTYPTGGRLRSTPLVAHGWVYLSCAAQAKWGGVVALRLGDGREMGRWQSPSRRGVLETPVLDDRSRCLYFGSLDDDGKTVYRADIGCSVDAQLIFQTIGPIRARLILDSERQCIYVASYGGIIHALSLDGAELWRREVEGPINAAGVLANGTLYLGTEGGLVYGLDPSNKSADIWPPFRAQGPVVATPIVHEDVLIFGSRDGNVYAIDTTTGEQCGEFATGGEVLAPLVCTESGMLLVGCGGQMGGSLQAIPRDLGRTA